ncbi:hypothetical protein M3172_25355 [Mesobacillus subterraneus]|uniref:hypothetical protein n=1 Tax=Mesobacillus subterraneus TaxID=285983 RepID=UPI00203DED5C|nr:hypothetical protein [Mesobacillus subterraneus]MCM3576475.1 hypothetical protein [Mesobacillus subterraneus]
MEYNLWGYEVEVTKKEATFILLKRQFIQWAEEYSEDMGYFYDDYKSIGRLIEYAPKTAKHIYSKVIQNSVDLLRNNGVYHIDNETFTNYCEHYCFNLSNNLSEIYEKYMELVGERQLAEEFRRYRKSTRARVVGGGFGISGAVKGMAIAGAANATTGLIHSLFNSVGGAMTNAKINKEINRIYDAPKTKQAIVDGIYLDIMDMFNVFIEVCQTVNPNLEIEYTQEMEQRAKTIYHNLVENLIPQVNIEEAVVDMLINAPHIDDYYLLAYHLLGDEDGELDKFSKAFYSSIDIGFIKQADDNAKAFFGTDYNKIENDMKYNNFYKALRHTVGSPLKDMASTCLELVSGGLAERLYSFETEDKYDQVKLKNAISTFAFFPKYETPIFLFDNSTFSNGKDGFVITDKSIYYPGGRIKIKDITEIKRDLGIIINGIKMPTSVILTSTYQLENLLNFIKTISHYMPDIINSGEHFIYKPELTFNLNEESSSQYAQELLTSLSNSDLSKYLYSFSNDVKSVKKFNNALSSYAKLGEEEFALILFDNTAFGSAKDGCLISNKGIHVHNTFSSAKFFSFDTIQSIELKGTFSKVTTAMRLFHY